MKNVQYLTNCFALIAMIASEINEVFLEEKAVKYSSVITISNRNAEERHT